LIDCGEGTQMQLRRLRVRMGRLDHILISHLHGDHVFGLFGLLSSLGLTGREHPLHVYGPPELESVVLRHLEMFDIHLPYEVIHHPLDCTKGGAVYEDKVLTVRHFPLRHRIPACGYLFREKERRRRFRPGIFERYEIPVAQRRAIQEGAPLRLPDGSEVPNEEITMPGPPPRSYAFCSDTAYDRAVAGHVRGVDLLYHEATFAASEEARARETGHATARQAALIAREAGVGKLIIGHFSARYKDLTPLLEEARTIFPETYLAADGARFEIPLRKEANGQ